MFVVNVTGEKRHNRELVAPVHPDFHNFEFFSSREKKTLEIQKKERIFPYGFFIFIDILPSCQISKRVFPAPFFNLSSS